MPRKGKFIQGTYRPKNKSKYIGKKAPIYRSSWEQRFMLFCDTHSSITAWASEAISIPYLDPFTGKKRNYWPDFLIQYQDQHGREQTDLIEIKPLNQTTLKEAGRSKHNQAAACLNEAKWEAALRFCKQANIKFRVLTEKDIFCGTGRRK